MNVVRTQEIGSFRKPDYLTSKFKTMDREIFEEKAGLATIETIELFRKAGLDNLGVGGEMFRWEMYEHPATRTNGIHFYGPVRSFDNKFYNKGSVVSEISRKQSWHADEAEFLKKNAMGEIKIPLTGPYTMMDWSYNEYYENREELARAFAKVINREIQDLKKIMGEGILQVQIDEPAATTHPDEMGIVRDAVNESIEGIQDIETHLHVCYSTDYGLLFKELPDMNIDVFNLEFANRDGTAVTDERKGYLDVRRFAEVNETVTKKRALGMGVTDVHVDNIESIDLIESRIKYALKYLDPSLLRINPDCGLRTRSREVGFQKLVNMVKARDNVLKSI